MKVYKISPILKYSPFFELTYVSKFDFKAGEIVGIDFNNKKIFGVVLEKYDLKDAKVEIRKAGFQTKKIEERGENGGAIFTPKQFKALCGFSKKYAIPLGEVIFFLFGDTVNMKKNVFEKIFTFEKDKIIVKDFSFEKYLLLTNPHIPRLELFFIWLSNFYANKKVNLILEANFFGTSELVFLESYDDFKTEIKESGYKAKKFLVKVENEEIISQEVLDKIKDQKTFIFVLSTGYADRIYCNDCSKPYACEKCGHDYSLLAEESGNSLYCKSCKHKKELKKDQYVICKNCGGWRMFSFGIGNQKVLEFLQEKNIEMKNIKVGGIKELNKYLKKGEVFDTTIVASLGPLVKGKNFDSDEKLIRLLSNLENISREIYINKHVGDEISLDNFKNKEMFVKEELKLRKKLNLPPFTVVMSFIFNFKNKRLIDKFLNEDIEKYKISGQIVKGQKYIYYWFIPNTTEGKDTIYSMAKVFRNYGEVIVGNSIVEKTILGR